MLPPAPRGAMAPPSNFCRAYLDRWGEPPGAFLNVLREVLGLGPLPGSLETCTLRPPPYAVGAAKFRVRIWRCILPGAVRAKRAGDRRPELVPGFPAPQARAREFPLGETVREADEEGGLSL